MAAYDGRSFFGHGPACASSASGVDIQLDVREIGFTQNKVTSTFTDGAPIKDVIDGIKKGFVATSDFPKIRVVQMTDGSWVSLDNRRLKVFKEGLKGKHGPQYVHVEEMKLSDPHPKHHGRTIGDELKRKQNSPDPRVIQVKDGLRNWETRVGRNGGEYYYDKHHKKVYVSQQTDKQKRERQEGFDKAKAKHDRADGEERGGAASGGRESRGGGEVDWEAYDFGDSHESDGVSGPMLSADAVLIFDSHNSAYVNRQASAASSVQTDPYHIAQLQLEAAREVGGDCRSCGRPGNPNTGMFSCLPCNLCGRG